MEIIEGGIYRHYKGGLYRIISTECLHEKTLEKLVIYENCSDGKKWARPLKEFTDQVTNHRDGVQTLRYVPHSPGGTGH